MEVNNKPDMVSHPPHYQSAAGLEVIDVIEAFTADLKGVEATDTGNIIKYICRWNHKNGLEDLKKAKWYLEHLIKKVAGKNTVTEEPEIDRAETPCEFEGKPQHPYGDKQCLGKPGYSMCDGRVNCDIYKAKVD